MWRIRRTLRDAETSSDDMMWRFRNQVTLSSRTWSGIWAYEKPWQVVAGSEFVRARETGWSLSGSPFSEKNGCKFQDASCKKKKEDLFLKGNEVSSLLKFNKRASRFWIKFRMTGCDVFVKPVGMLKQVQMTGLTAAIGSRVWQTEAALNPYRLSMPMNNHQGLHTGSALRSNRRTGPRSWTKDEGRFF